MNSMNKPTLSSIEAEQQLLGSIMLANDRLDLVSDILQASHFFDPLHGFLFDLCKSRITAGHLCSPVSLPPLMGERLQPVGGPAYLARMAGASVSSAMIRDYAKIIVDMAARRSVQEAAQSAIDGLSGGVGTGEVSAALSAALAALPETGGEESTYSLGASVVSAMDQAVRAYQGEAEYLKTGVAALDETIKGLAPGDMCIIGGATSMGKTSLALEIAHNVAKSGKGVCFVSLEMMRQDLANRMACSIARVPYADLREPGKMSEGDFRKYIEASQHLLDLPFRIVPRHVRDMAAVHAAVRRAKREMNGNLGLVVIDYAQLIRGTGKDRYQQMTEVSVGIKALAGLLEVPVIPLVQLSRDIGNRDDKRPHLSDIKETGQFENDADQVIFCHRESYWLERQGPTVGKDGKVSTSAHADWEADMTACRNLMEVIVRKNRHGPLATCQVGFHPPTNRFWRLDHQSGGFDL
jgi:replicative DNA helicase